MKQYHTFLQDILKEGRHREDRTGTGTTSLFAARMDFDLTKGFPLQTTKRVFWRGVVEELLWMLRGETNINSLQDKDVNIWNEWANENGDLGPVYGKQWRSWTGEAYARVEYDSPVIDFYEEIDQIKNAINLLRKSPDSRRIIVTAWNPAEIGECALPPCHVMFQFYTREMTLRERWINVANPGDFTRFDTLQPENAERLLDEAHAPRRYLDCHLYQRSGDAFLGIPFNIASYSLLTHMIAEVVGMQAGRFVHTIGDAHIYDNHMDQVKEILSRKPNPLPTLFFKKVAKEIDDFTSFEDFGLSGYDPHPPVPAPVAV